MTTETPRPWHDLAHTVAVHFARAFAEHERRGRRTIFTFELMAASTSSTVTLPIRDLAAQDEGITLNAEPQGNEIRVTLQLDGVAALDAHAGKAAHLVSRNGAIDYPLVFDADGQAVCLLANRPEIVAGLASFTLEASDA